MSAFIVGSTGLCGNYILKHAPEYYEKIYSISRSQPDNSSSTKVEVLIEKDSQLWAEKIKSINDSNKEVFFSGLGTTRGKVGGLANQYKIDHDLNLELAKAAKESGFKQYVLISSLGASSNSSLPYLKMKGELEDNVLELGFERTIILRPGVLIGERKSSHGIGSAVFSTFGSWVHNTFLAKYTVFPVSGEEVGLAALKLSKTPITEKVVFVGGLDVNKASHQ